jgi:hypothetical protein
MPTIKNKTTQLICLTSRGGDCIAIDPDSSKQIPAELWADNKDMDCIQSMLDDRRILVINQAEPPSTAPAPVAEAPPAPAPAPAPEPEDIPGDWSKVHWRKAKRIITAADDTAPLYKLLENEDRAKIKSMLEARIEELEA